MHLTSAVFFVGWQTLCFTLGQLFYFSLLWFPHLQIWEKLCLPYTAAVRMNDPVCKGPGT